MITVEQMRNVAQDLIASYDDRVDAIGAIIENAYQVLEDFKDKRAKLSHELKETLATRHSLRKKDFDRMMNGILLSQEEREKEVKQSLKNFLKEQKEEAFELKDALTKGEVERMKKAQMEMEKGIAEIKGALKDFCEQQETLTDQLRKLLTKGEDLKIKELQDTIRNLQTLTIGKEVKKMGLQDVATDIKALGQDMADSYVDRKRMIEALQKEVKLRVKEVSDLLKGFQEEHSERKAEVAQMLESFVDDLHKEIKKLIQGFQRENQERQDEVGEVAAATKEMWSTVARAKGGAKKLSAHSMAEVEPKKRARRAKGK
jgi:DNA-binding transcriptional MerR regulator